MSSSSAADNPGQFFKQSIASKDHQTIVHRSTRPLVASYNGTWRQRTILGRGSSGIVYFDRKDISEQVRAVKMITAGRPESIALEIECMIRMKKFSAHVVGIQCWWTDNETTYIAMDYHCYFSLRRHVLTDGAFTEDVAREITEQLLWAVFALHHHSIVHRDIKPENILIHSLSPISIRLADFGLARITDKLSPSAFNSCSGTADWAAPEQLCEGQENTSQVDLWAVGCVVYFLLTELNPFSNRERRVQEPASALARHTVPFWPRVTRTQFVELTECDRGHCIIVPGASFQVNRFLMALITPTLHLRLTAMCALRHPWINPAGIDLVYLAQRTGSGPLVNLLSKSEMLSKTPVYKLRVAAASGDLAGVNSILRDAGSGRMLDDSGLIQIEPLPALVGAAAAGHGLVVTRLLQQLEYRNGPVRTDVATTACQRALLGGHDAVAADLWPLVRDRVNFADTAGRGLELATAAAAFGNSQFLQRLMRHIMPELVSTSQPYYVAMTTEAARHGNSSNLTTLLVARPRVLPPDDALLAAASAGHPHVVQLLLEKRDFIPTQPSLLPAPDDVPSAALALAAAGGHLSTLRYLVKRGVAPTQPAIAAAAQHDQTECFQLLVSALQQIYQWPVFTFIPPAGIPHCTLALLKQHRRPAELRRHLAGAARLGRKDLVMWLLETVSGAVAANGQADVMWEGATVREALMRAAEAGQTDMIELLVTRGGLTDADIRAALETAFAADNVGAVMLLLMQSPNGPYRKGGDGKRKI